MQLITSQSASFLILNTAVFPTKVYEDSNFKDIEDEYYTRNLIIPYQVRIDALDKRNKVSGECFGTLISKKHVLTTRKCTHRVTNFNVYVRYNDTNEKVSACRIFLDTYSN